MKRDNPWFPVIPAALLLALCSAGCDLQGRAPRTAARKQSELVAVDKPQPPLIDEDYCFRIESPGQEWKLVSERDIQRIMPDAVAGAFHSSGAYGVVIIELMPTNDLTAYAEMLTSNASFPEYPFSPLEETTFQGRPAVRFGRTASVSGMDMTYDHLVFVHEEHGYQLVSLALTPKYSADVVRQFHDAFQLTEGTVRGRSRPPIADFDGVGRRVVDGRFESAVFRFAVEPRNDWQLFVGQSLSQVSVEAEVGLEHAVRGMYVVVIPEYAGNVDPESFRQDRWNTMIADYDVTRLREETLNLSIDGRNVEFRQFETEPPFRYYWAVHFENDIAYRFQAWHALRDAEESSAEIAAAMETVRFLDHAVVETISAEMLARADPENVVGPGFSLRGGVYRDFSRGTVWTKPSGFWRVRVGQDAQAISDAVSLEAQEPRRGLWLELIDETDQVLPAAEYHSVILNDWFDSDHPIHTTAPAETPMGNHTALVSEGDLVTGENTLTFRVATVVHGQQAHQILVWGMPEHMSAARRHVDEVLNGFRFGEPLRETISKGPRYRDNRVGFEIGLPDQDWSVRDKALPAISPIGNALEFKRPGQTVLVIGFTAFQPGQDMSFAEEIINDMYRVNFSRLAQSDPIESRSSLGGLPSKVKTWTIDGNTTQTAVAVKDRTVFALIVTDNESNGTLAKSAVAGFRLLQ